MKTADGKREKWRETHFHVVFLPLAFATDVMLNLSNEARPNDATLMTTAKVQDTREASIDLACVEEADKTWVVHQIHEFLDDEFQINKIRTDLCSRMYCKRL